MKEKIMPPLVLMLISTIVCTLLVAANAATKDKIIEAQKDKFNKSLSDTFGAANYTSIDLNFEETHNEIGDDDYTPVDLSLDGIDSITRDEKGRIIFEITADGYAKDGLHLLIGFNEQGTIEGISFLSIGETPGLGTKVKDDKSFIEQFKDVSSTDYDFSVITGATYSSNAMKSAVDLALSTYNEHKEEILNG